jgi:hypothetical protein
MSSVKHIKMPDSFTPSIKLNVGDVVDFNGVIKRVSLEGKQGSRVDRNNYTGNGHWDFEEQMGVKKHIGFIYLIRNTVTNRCYIGKKQYRGTGKLNKGEVSNWPWYISSSKELSNDIKTYGKEMFDFICLEEYTAKGALSFAETWSLCHVEAPSNPDKWYNVLINKVSWSVKEPITNRHKLTLETLIEAYHK